MSPLKVSDLKPGDVVRMDLEVTSSGEFTARLSLPDASDFLLADDADLAAGNAERVVRPRPVRKGDEITTGFGPYVFIALLDSWVIAYRESLTNLNAYSAEQPWTHADGSPIDWEASE